MNSSALTVPIWLPISIAISTPILTVLVALWTARLATRREHGNWVENTRVVLRGERRDAYVTYAMAIEELAYWLSPKNVNVELDESEVRSLHATLAKGRVRVKISGSRGIGSVIGSLDRIVQNIFEIRFGQRLSSTVSSLVPLLENVERVEVTMDEIVVQMTSIGHDTIRLVHKAVIEAVRAELEVDTLLDSDSIKRDSWLKCLRQIIQLVSIVHPIRGVRDTKKYLEGQRNMHLNSLLKTIADVKEANAILKDIRAAARGGHPR